MSILFFHNNHQENVINRSKEKEEKKRGKKLHTEIKPFTTFYLAEAYHQKYYLQLRKQLVHEFVSFYPETKDFINSTSAARVNGYVRGEGTIAALKSEISLLGLSEKGQDILLEIVRSFGR